MTTHSAHLLRRLNPYCAQALAGAATLCQTRAHAEITVEHWLLKLLEQGEGDITVIARRYEWDMDSLWQGLLAHLDTLPRTVQGKPQLSAALQQLIKNAWLDASLQEDAEAVRSVHLLSALINSPSLLAADAAWPLLSLSTTQLHRLLPLLDNQSDERPEIQQAAALADSPVNLTDEAPTVTSASGQPQLNDALQAALDKFTLDVTAKARANQIDPIFGRDSEIRQMIDILSRRRKNNPILVGEPGVGKTALVEGLALRIAEGNVPDSLKTVSVRTLDLGLLQAGAGVKGEFEQRLKNVIEAVQQSPSPVLLFIDEAHTIIGAGNQAGGADAANLLKPALARGELRTIAATTWSEYKQYFERDAALERRFQMVKVDEPDDDTACLMLRGLKERYATHHGVHILDAAITAAVTLSRRFLTGRQLPDKAVDLLDTAGARVRMSIDTLPRTVQGKPQLSAALQQLIKNAWLDASLQEDAEAVRSVHLLSALINSPSLLAADAAWPLLSLSTTQLHRLLPLLDNQSDERPEIQQAAALADSPVNLTDEAATVTSASGQPQLNDALQAALDKFTLDVTAKARANQIDPIFGRDSEIRQMIDILSRRRKNNPILVGEPGVGKTALVEGLALRIADGNVPDSLKTVSVRTLDLGLLQAGAGVKGEFEQRLKNVIEAVQQSPSPVLLFIDEAHTIIGAGNQAGGADAANLLKPALARGELRTIAATTWSEYKQYFERDAALERRFQMVKVDEPDDDTACLMLRGLKERYATHHGVHILDAAITAAVTLSRRFLTGRQLPDKAVDLLDTAGARVRMSIDTLPTALIAINAELAALAMEQQAIEQDLLLLPNVSSTRLPEIEQRRAALAVGQHTLEQQYKEEKRLTTLI
ncbi:AAA family ATPase, partial [Yersinia pseudotuberculosis]|uniref:AAA family ATPase n=1 Tax=Yersinia pseudotuberculosis TaxID=633 RepID=UPI000A6D8844